MNQRRKYTDIICNSCGITFKRQAREVKRRVVEGHKAYCSRKCAVLIHRKNLGKYLGVGRAENFKGSFGTKRDQFTPFRRFLSSVKKRNIETGKEYDIDLQYLKDLWDKQQGVCPLTGWKLSIPKFGRKQEARNASLDRIDSSLGYMKNNIRFIALIANYCKHQFTDNEVKEFCVAVTLNIDIKK